MIIFSFWFSQMEMDNKESRNMKKKKAESEKR